MTGWQPPPYPHDRLAGLHERADEVTGGGRLDLSVGDPCDPLPEVVRDALGAHSDRAGSYPATVGFPEYRRAASDWMERRLGASVPSEQVVACVGTKELVAGLPRLLHLRDPSRGTVLYPAVAYPTYAMGAELAGLRAVPVPCDDQWRPDLSQVDGDDALLLWLNHPGNPTGSVVDAGWYRQAVAWARQRGIVVASDECYVEFTFDGAPATALAAGAEGVLAVHSLSKRSNMTGLRAGFVAGDAALTRYLGEVRKHAGLMVPGPVQMAAAAALGDDDHVDAQRQVYADRRKLALDALAGTRLVHEGGPGAFYLWLADATGELDGWGVARLVADAGIVAAPGELYGDAGRRHARLALVAPGDVLEPAFERLAAVAAG